MKKSKKRIFEYFIIAIFIVAASFMPYIHDFKIFAGMEGFSGFSSFRIGLWAVSLFTVALSGWIFAFIGHKGKPYRFAMFAPIFMLAYQLGIYLFDARNTKSNEITFKVIVNISFILILVVFYFYRKYKEKK